jgi:pyruvate dehydrogenase E2 component (dihydrolipoamide acetyltransferase)
MLKKVIMPALGATMTTGTILKWLKEEGDQVKKGEPIVEIETEKVVVEVESLDAGILKRIVAQEGEEIPVTEVIAYIGDEEDEVPRELDVEAGESRDVIITETAAEPAPALVSAKAEGEDRIKASPVARKLAEEKGFDLRLIPGSGPGGRISREDVVKAIAEKEKRVVSAEVVRAAAPQVPGTRQPPGLSELGVPRIAEVIPLAGARKIIAKRLARSFRDTPHIVINMTVDMTQAKALRDSLLSVVEEKWGVRLSYTDLIMKVSALALQEYPRLNSSLADEEIRLYQDVNVGLAVATSNGLIVPTIFGTDRLSLPEIAMKREELVSKSQEGSLTLDEVSGGTFTVSNLGMYGVESFSAIINPPQAAILAVGAIEERAAVREGQIGVRPQLTLSLSADHRVVDGALAAQFLARVRQLLENPSVMLI